MRFGSLFAGIGGFNLGLEWAGMICSWQVEIDDYCTRVLEKHWPDVTRYKDVKNVGKENLKSVDLICGGFPCQPHSVAGKRRGAQDDRDLWPEYRRVVDELRPRWVVGENVPGIRTTILDQVLSDLEDMAYTTGTLNIPACAFNAPHRRERIFIIAHTYKSCKPNITINEQWKISRTMDVSYTESNIRRASGDDRSKTPDGGSYAPNATVEGLEGEVAERRDTGKQGLLTEPDWWTVEPDVGRVAHGIPSRVDRLRALGNAVVPQVAEFIGRQIMVVDHLTCVARCEDKN